MAPQPTAKSVMMAGFNNVGLSSRFIMQKTHPMHSEYSFVVNEREELTPW